MKKLSELYNINNNTLISDIKINSKEVKEGDLFVCTTGVTADRHDYIDDAVKNKASAIVVSKDIKRDDVCVIRVEDTNKHLPIICSKFYDHPEEKLHLIGVTGTNGKTTVAEIIRDMIGYDNCGYIGTNGVKTENETYHTNNTTPGAEDLYKYLDMFVKNNYKYAVLEASSEAFYRHRLDNLNFDIGIVTNVTNDHFNIHKTYENYIECKSRLLKQTKICSILNKDDSSYEYMKNKSTTKILSYGKTKDSSLQILNINYTFTNTKLEFKYENNIYNVESPLIGEHNVYNLASAILSLLSLDYKMEDIINRIKNIKIPEGRSEVFKTKQGSYIILDYAHNPQALKNILTFLNTQKKTRLITLTGSAGGRDHSKRAEMGEIVLDNSDLVVFTMDDPRYEKVIDIINDMIKTTTKTNYKIIEDRKDAIKYAIETSEKDDIVLITGKGRDNYMAIEDKKLPYNDYDEIVKDIKNEDN